MTLPDNPESKQNGTPEQGGETAPSTDGSPPDRTVEAAAETPPSSPTTADVQPETQAQPSVETTAAAALDATTPPAGTAQDAGVKESQKPAAERPARPAGERPARPAKAEEPKEAPRVAPPPGSVFEALSGAAAGIEMKAYMVPDLRGESVCVEVARDDVPVVLATCRDDERLQLKYLRCLSGVDWMEDGLEVVYHLWSMTKMHGLTVKTRVPYDDANVPSVADIYPAANWHEREVRDMFGINFPGHPELVPLLLPEDMTDHFPLRKENPLQEILEWQGENLREGAGEGDE